LGFAATVCRFVLGEVFLLAGLAKIADRNAFEAATARYGLLPTRLVRPVARWLPILEVAAGGALVVGAGVVYASAALGAALVGFTLVVGLSLVRGETFDCGCRAAGAPRKIGWGVVARNLVLIAAAVVAAIEAPHALALDALVAGSSDSVGSSDAAALLFATALGVLTVVLAGESISLHRATRASGRSGT
jgi:uncharacterized membrane protein YphA (DoxX/SURF4 family)